jgi:hypothetical protein
VRVGGHLVVVLAIAGTPDALEDALLDEPARVGADAGAAHGQTARDLVEGELLG